MRWSGWGPTPGGPAASHEEETWGLCARRGKTKDAAGRWPPAGREDRSQHKPNLPPPLNLGLPGSGTVRNKFLNSQLSSPWCFVAAALKAGTGRFCEFPRISDVLTDPVTKCFRRFKVTVIKTEVIENNGVTVCDIGSCRENLQTCHPRSVIAMNPADHPQNKTFPKLSLENVLRPLRTFHRLVAADRAQSPWGAREMRPPQHRPSRARHRCPQNHHTLVTGLPGHAWTVLTPCLLCSAFFYLKLKPRDLCRSAGFPKV